MKTKAKIISSSILGPAVVGGAVTGVTVTSLQNDDKKNENIVNGDLDNNQNQNTSNGNNNSSNNNNNGNNNGNIDNENGTNIGGGDSSNVDNGSSGNIGNEEIEGISNKNEQLEKVLQLSAKKINNKQMIQNGFKSIKTVISDSLDSLNIINHEDISFIEITKNNNAINTIDTVNIKLCFINPSNIHSSITSSNNYNPVSKTYTISNLETSTISVEIGSDFTNKPTSVLTSEITNFFEDKISKISSNDKSTINEYSKGLSSIVNEYLNNVFNTNNFQYIDEVTLHQQDPKYGVVSVTNIEFNYTIKFNQGVELLKTNQEEMINFTYHKQNNSLVSSSSSISSITMINATAYIQSKIIEAAKEVLNQNNQNIILDQLKTKINDAILVYIKTPIDTGDGVNDTYLENNVLDKNLVENVIVKNTGNEQNKSFELQINLKQSVYIAEHMNHNGVTFDQNNPHIIICHITL